jgi:adenylate cyclase
MSAVSLTALRAALEGAIPSEIATCDALGTPNVSVISDVHYVDTDHVAISYQFFSKTRANILANPHATVLLKHPNTCAQYRLQLTYLRTELAGPLFETMRAKLAGIASHEGMSGIFHLLGADIYHVDGAEIVRGDLLPLPPPHAPLLAALRQTLPKVRAARDLDGLVAILLEALRSEFRLPHVMLLMADDACDRLYTVASQGYPESGVGAEILPGQGVIGVAARERTPIRITHATRDYLMAAPSAMHCAPARWPPNWRPKFRCRACPTAAARSPCRSWVDRISSASSMRKVRRLGALAMTRKMR